MNLSRCIGVVGLTGKKNVILYNTTWYILVYNHKVMRTNEVLRNHVTFANLVVWTRFTVYRWSTRKLTNTFQEYARISAYCFFLYMHDLNKNDTT
jgi:hypothetical protein